MAYNVKDALGLLPPLCKGVSFCMGVGHMLVCGLALAIIPLVITHKYADTHFSSSRVQQEQHKGTFSKGKLETGSRL